MTFDNFIPILSAWRSTGRVKSHSAVKRLGLGVRIYGIV